MGCFACFDGGNKKQRRSEGFVGVNNNQQPRKLGFVGGGNKQQRKEAERLASEEARAKAAQAAQKR